MHRKTTKENILKIRMLKVKHSWKHYSSSVGGKRIRNGFQRIWKPEEHAGGGLFISHLRCSLVLSSQPCTSQRCAWLFRLQVKWTFLFHMPPRSPARPWLRQSSSRICWHCLPGSVLGPEDRAAKIAKVSVAMSLSSWVLASGWDLIHIVLFHFYQSHRHSSSSQPDQRDHEKRKLSHTLSTASTLARSKCLKGKQTNKKTSTEVRK